MTPPSALRRKSKTILIQKIFRLIFCLNFIFAAIDKTFTLASHNLHGFKKSSAFHKKCIQSYGGVWFSQEIWLPENRLSQLCKLGVQFVAHSGMEAAMSSGIMRGRPHGGVSIAWSSDLDHAIKPLINYRHKRVVCVEVDAEPDPLLLVSIYMPFFDASKRQECMAEASDTVSMLEEIISDHPLHKVIIGGDYNSELNGSSPFDPLWDEFMNKYDLICCDQFVNNNNNNNNKNFTYFHESLNQKKWSDHFLVSTSFAQSTANHEIIDVGDNTSNHLPIKFQLSCKISAEPARAESSKKSPSLKWEKCNDEQKNAYSTRLADLLFQNPDHSTSCSIAHCRNSDCLSAVQKEYDKLIELISLADKVLPRHKPGVQKHWWSNELTELRKKSIEIHRLWQLEGKPRSGPTSNERLRVRAAYKKAIKLARKSPNQATWNKLHGSLLTKSTTTFWKSWKQLYCKNQSDLHNVVNGVTSRKDIADSFQSHFVKVSKPNNQQRVDCLEESFRKQYDETVASHVNCSCSDYNISVENVIDAVLSMQKGKCCDDSSINAEHFFYAPLPLFDRLQRLFNKMLLHGQVPLQFQRGTIIPLVKDSKGDKGDLNNYRGITIAPIQM